jgi:hypothetical protein
VAIGDNVAINRAQHFHIGSNVRPLGTVSSTTDYVTKYWPVVINGNLERIALLC